MSIERKTMIALAAGAALVAGVAGIALAQSSPTASIVAAAIADGSVGEQADGYLGFKSQPSAAVRDAVEAINIKRRAAYTQLATQRGVTVKDVAATIGCETLSRRVNQGHSYMLNDGVWRTKGAAAIALPAYCVS